MRFELIDIGRPITYSYNQTPQLSKTMAPTVLRGEELILDSILRDPAIVVEVVGTIVSVGVHSWSLTLAICSLLLSTSLEKIRVVMANNPQASRVADLGLNK